MKKLKWSIIPLLMIIIVLWSVTQEIKPNPKIDLQSKVQNQKLSVIAVGDALIHGAIYNDANTHQIGDDGYNQYDFSKMFKAIPEIISPYDLKFYNQETVIGGKKLGLSHYPLFNSPDEIGLDLINIGFNVVNLASNHTLDKGIEGASYSAQFWETQKGVYAVGSYTSQEKRDRIRIEETNGIKYSILSYTYGTNGISIPPGREYLVNLYHEDQVKEDIEKVRNQVDLLIVSMHWGTEYTHEPNELQRKQANYLASLGVDVIIGHHPHVIQPIEWIDDTLVIYSLGNFISAQDGINKRTGMIATFTFHQTVRDGKTIHQYISDVQADLLWTHYVKGYSKFEVIPFPRVTDEHLPDVKQVYEQYKKIINPYNDERITVGFLKE